MYKSVLNFENDDYLIFRNFNLTELMLLKKNGRRVKLTENYALYNLLKNKLLEYGILLVGQFERSNLTFRSIMIMDELPIENELIIKELYGYFNFTAHIQLRGFEDFSVAFDYELDTGICELQRHCYGSISHRIKFITFKEMIEYIRLNGYDNLFK